MKAKLYDREYPHIMIAERQREFAVSIRALRMMQEHYGNPYFSFKCITPAEESDWRAKAEAEVPQVEPVSD